MFSVINGAEETTGSSFFNSFVDLFFTRPIQGFKDRYINSTIDVFKNAIDSKLFDAWYNPSNILHPDHWLEDPTHGRSVMEMISG